MRNKDQVLTVLAELRSTDPALKAFGASSHQYLLNPPLPEADLASLEPLSSNRAPQGVGDADLGGANRCPASTRHQDPR